MNLSNIITFIQKKVHNCLLCILQGVQSVQEARGYPVAQRLVRLQHQDPQAGAEELGGQGLHQGQGHVRQRGAQHHPALGGGEVAHSIMFCRVPGMLPVPKQSKIKPKV